MDIDRIPAMFLKGASEGNLNDNSSNETVFKPKENFDSLGSISAFVTNKEECEEIAEEMFLVSGVEQSNDDETDLETETDEEDYECVVCKLNFVGEDKLGQHRRIAQHWG